VSPLIYPQCLTLKRKNAHFHITKNAFPYNDMTFCSTEFRSDFGSKNDKNPHSSHYPTGDNGLSTGGYDTKSHVPHISLSTGEQNIFFHAYSKEGAADVSEDALFTELCSAGYCQSETIERDNWQIDKKHLCVTDVSVKVILL
jgi:hypothetical protein